MPRPPSVDFSKLWPTQKNSLLMLTRLWTNFNSRRANTGDYEVLDSPAEGYWEFITSMNLEWINNMEPKHRNRFLFAMEEHYHKRAEDDEGSTTN